MPREFKVPGFYRSDKIAGVKKVRKVLDPKKKDVSPTVIDCGEVKFKIARHFGFCFGVENAIEIAYRAIADNPNKSIFLLSEMIHNPEVNQDLRERGVKFLMSTKGQVLIPFSELSADDVVIVPAFGTTLELQKRLEEVGIDPYYYDTTCPFVEKVWKRSSELGSSGYTVIVHGKRSHEETRATFSHSEVTASTLIIRDLDEAAQVCRFIAGEMTCDEFYQRFSGCTSDGFDPERDLQRLGVVNQTTMLATETQEISDLFRKTLESKWGKASIKYHFADTRNTLCYATYENQSATRALIDSGADLAIVVGGYNSSNTSHLVELCAESMPTYYIRNALEIISELSIRSFDLKLQEVRCIEKWLPEKRPLAIAITSGASCPDAIVDAVIRRILELIPNTRSAEDAFSNYFNSHSI